MKKKKRAVIFLCGFLAFLVFAGCTCLIYYIDMPKPTEVQKQESGINYYAKDIKINIGIASERYIFLLNFNCKESNCNIVCCNKDRITFENTKEAFWKIFGFTPDVTADFQSDRLIAEITKIGGFFIDGQYYTGVEAVNSLNEDAATKNDYHLLCSIMGEFIAKELESKSSYIFECSNAGRPWFEDNRDTLLAAMQNKSFDYIL